MSEPTNASPDGVRSGELDLDGIEARANAATEGPWARNGLSDVEGSVATFHRVGLGPHVLDAIILTDTQRDADFIAHAREDVPALVAEVRRLRALVGRVEDLAADGPFYVVDFHGPVESIDVQELRRLLSGHEPSPS